MPGRTVPRHAPDSEERPGPSPSEIRGRCSLEPHPECTHAHTSRARELRPAGFRVRAQLGRPGLRIRRVRHRRRRSRRAARRARSPAERRGHARTSFPRRCIQWHSGGHRSIPDMRMPSGSRQRRPVPP
jgi:hypothetical protein